MEQLLCSSYCSRNPLLEAYPGPSNLDYMFKVNNETLEQGVKYAQS